MNGPLEAAAYQRRRLVAALLGRPAPPSVLRPLVGGVLVTAALVAGELVRRHW